MSHERICGNPLCGSPFRPARVDGFYCSSSCRAEAVRLRELLQGSGPVAKAVRTALHKRAVPKKKRGSGGARPDTPYTVLEVIQKGGLAVTFTLAGLAAAHSRNDAVREVAEHRDATEFLPLSRRSFALLGPDGEPVKGGLFGS